MKYAIRSIPTIMLFWKGQPIMRSAGALIFQQLKQQIESHWPAMNQVI